MALTIILPITTPHNHQTHSVVAIILKAVHPSQIDLHIFPYTAIVSLISSFISEYCSQATRAAARAVTGGGGNGGFIIFGHHLAII